MNFPCNFIFTLRDVTQESYWERVPASQFASREVHCSVVPKLTLLMQLNGFVFLMTQEQNGKISACSQHRFPPDP